jgi:hypothetical protein
MPNFLKRRCNRGETTSFEKVVFQELSCVGEKIDGYDFENSTRPKGGKNSPPEWPKQPSRELSEKLFDKKLTALCLSGGGIRSATFCLGILQALAKEKLLSQFHYLSTVSGGGYIGAWLSAWASRSRSDVALVEKSLAPDGEEPAPLMRLRDFTNYLTPRRGPMGLDSWTFVSTYLRNLILNWLLLAPLFLFVVWAPKATALIFEFLEATYFEAQENEWARCAVLALAAVIYAVAFAVSSAQLVDVKIKADAAADDETEAAAREQKEQYGYDTKQFLLRILAPSQLAAICATVALAREPAAHLISVEGLRDFAIGGAVVWTVPFLLVAALKKGRQLSFGWPSPVWARVIGGALFGVILASGFWLVQCLSQNDDRIVVVFGAAVFMIAHMAGQIIFAALTSEITRFDDVLEWAARAAAAWLIFLFIWMALASVVLWSQELQQMLFSYLGKWGQGLLLSSGVLTGFVSALLGKSERSPAKPGGMKAGGAFDPTKVALLCALIFFLILFFELSIVFDWIVLRGDSLGCLLKERCVSPERVRDVLVALVAIALWQAVASRVININRFSLHAFYRNRLIRAYLGASNDNRSANAFTGFDQRDNLDMCELHAGKPFLIANTALNLVHGKRLAWQERKATSFTISRCAAGNPAVGYRPSGEYGNAVSLGTAMAISGAAISPNMGYHTSAILSFMMTLFNARLGWWLGNPWRENWREASPRRSSLAIVAELFGLTDDESDYVYLSDGGHFENLGVYEMLRRRCRTIVVIDAGCDPELKFEDLGNLVRKARIDFNIEITFAEPSPPFAGLERARLGLVNHPKPPGKAPYCIIGDIAYPDIPDERASLIYIKAAIHGDEPEDVWAYAAAHSEFPHESTSDQFFSESQFESYRRLGLHIGTKIFSGRRKSRDHAFDLLERVKAHLAGHACSE